MPGSAPRSDAAREEPPEPGRKDQQLDYHLQRTHLAYGDRFALTGPGDEEHNGVDRFHAHPSRRHNFWARLAVNVGIVLVFVAFYFGFLKRP